MVDLNMFGKYLNLCTIMHEDINDNTRFYIYLGSILGFLLGVVVTMLIISIEHKLF